MLVPSAQPPHKARQDDIASPTDRLAMCQIAAEVDAAHAKVAQLRLVGEVDDPGPVAEQVALDQVDAEVAEKGNGVLMVRLGGRTFDITYWRDGGEVHLGQYPAKDARSIRLGVQVKTRWRLYWTRKRFWDTWTR